MSKLIWSYLGKHIDSLKGCQFDTASNERVEAFKMSIYKDKQSYLLDKKHLNHINETDIAKRSYLQSLNHNNHLVATSRLTPYPFEIGRIFKSEKKVNLDAYKDYLEISRLICTQKYLSTEFLIHSGCVAHKHGKYKGLIGLCRKHHLKSFQRFGFNVVAGPLSIKDRGNSDYYIVAEKLDVAVRFALTFVLLKKLKAALPSRPFLRNPGKVLSLGK